MKDDLQLQLGLSSPTSPNELLRKRWRHLVEERLPKAALTRDWPINQDHCFARVLLDNALGAPWRLVVRPPAWRNTPKEELKRAIALGEAVLADRIDLKVLNAKSLTMRKARR